MKAFNIAIIGIALLAGISSGCGRKNEAKERVKAERDAWIASLPDSLAAVKAQMDSLQSEISTLTQDAESMLPDFKYVDNPREVEGYYIANAWAPTYPLTATGLEARLTKSEQLELIAALGGGAHFDRIRVAAGGETAETSTVPHDQALNYRMAGLNTVCFSDSAAASCARLIADNQDTQIRIIYLNGGKETGALNYSKANAAVMAKTWNLYDTRRKIGRDERMIPMLAKKGAIISEKIETNKTEP